MPKQKLGTFLFIFLFLPFLILLFSPFISLILPRKFAQRSYYRLLYNAIVDKETAGCPDNKAKVLKLFWYVVNHEFLQGVPYKCKPAESLIYAEAYCDFQARTLNALLGVAGIPSRYAMLLDKDGISPHTLNEVFLDKKWSVFDPAMNIIFADGSGNNISLDEMSADPGLIYNNRKLAALKKYGQEEYNSFAECYPRLFPLPQEPRRSTPCIYQAHIFDYLVDAYFKIFKYNFFNSYQDLYLKFYLKSPLPEDLKLFYAARNYHLGYRFAEALKCYQRLLKERPATQYTQDALFFCAMLYFETGDLTEAVNFFRLIVDKYPQKWQDAAYYYLGRAYRLIGDKERSLDAYRRVAVYKLSAEILEELDSAKPR